MTVSTDWGEKKNFVYIPQKSRKASSATKSTMNIHQMNICLKLAILGCNENNIIQEYLSQDIVKFMSLLQ